MMVRESYRIPEKKTQENIKRALRREMKIQGRGPHLVGVLTSSPHQRSLHYRDPVGMQPVARPLRMQMDECVSD